MNILLLVIIPIATILISIVLQKILKKPVLVAILAFAIFLILAYTVFTPEFLLNAIIYAIIAFITVAIFKLICYLRRRINCNIFNVCDDSDNCSCNNDDDNDFGTSIANLEKSKENIVLISEQEAPEDFVCIWEQEFKRNLKKDKEAKEKLFIHNSLIK